MAPYLVVITDRNPEDPYTTALPFSGHHDAQRYADDHDDQDTRAVVLTLMHDDDNGFSYYANEES